MSSMPARNQEKASGRGVFVLPRTVVEVQPDFVLGARFSGTRPAGVRRMALQALDPGVLEPSSVQANIAKPELLRRAVGAIAGAIQNGGTLGLLLPDNAVRVSVLGFETLPAKSEELDALIRWRLKETLGYAPEAAKLSWQVNWTERGLTELLVIAAKRGVLSQYGAALSPLGGGAALILPVTMALMALCAPDEAAGQLLTHVCSGWVTHAVIEGNRLRLWRSRRLSLAAQDSGVSEVLSEAARATASARDRIGLEIKKAWCCARPAISGLDEELSGALGMAVESLPLDANADAFLEVGDKPLFAPFAAPLVGLLANAGKIA
ncbi:MAG: hypothetical protein ACRD1N_07940 [Terriglobia bacterium]